MVQFESLLGRYSVRAMRAVRSMFLRVSRSQETSFRTCEIISNNMSNKEPTYKSGMSGSDRVVAEKMAMNMLKPKFSYGKKC